MEHRHFPRIPVDLPIRIFSIDGKCYQAQLLELSAIGMRVVMTEKFPKKLKMVDVLLPGGKRPNTSRSERMFVAHRQGPVLGLCLLNERVKFDVNRQQLDGGVYVESCKLAG